MQGSVQQQPDGAAGEPARVSLPPPAGPVSYSLILLTLKLYYKLTLNHCLFPHLQDL